MKIRLNILVPLVLLAATAPALAATVSGRVTYMDMAGQRLMLDSNDLYAVAPAVHLSDLAVGETITADASRQHDQMTITKVLKHS
jgi:hypothetical protein